MAAFLAKESCLVDLGERMKGKDEVVAQLYFNQAFGSARALECDE
jgi:hypothetical protein